MRECLQSLRSVLVVSLCSIGCWQDSSENSSIENVPACLSLNEHITETQQLIDQTVDLQEFVGKTVADMETELLLTRTAPCLTKLVYSRSSCGVSAWTAPKLKNQILHIHWVRSTIGPVVRDLELIHVEKTRRSGSRLPSSGSSQRSSNS